jgi:DNA-binding transcriptional LysR family regulator
MAMERLDDMRAFVVVAEGLSFAEGAKRLSISPAQISKLVARLEDRLGARLLNRTTRDVSLTDTGRAYLERARSLLDEFDALEASVREAKGPSGLIRISAPVAFGTTQLSTALLDFAQSCPEIALEVAFTDRLANLVEEGLDLAIRIGRLADSSLIARRLAPVRVVTCAAPAYLERHGEPTHPKELAERDVILDLNASEPNLWAFGPPDGRTEVRVRGRLRFASADVCIAAARAGFGITRSPAFVAAEHLRSGALRTILQAYEPEPLHVHAIYPHARHLAPKVRAIVDFLVQRFAGEPAWHQGWT